MRCGTRDGGTLSRRRRLDPAPPRRPQQARHDRTMGCPQWGESGAWRPAFRAMQVARRRGDRLVAESKQGFLTVPASGAEIAEGVAA
jgi:hypothetical protein